tara:strand:+ start:1000 stop:2043 length:1044 start_codon:yes stop_codon:yes gene_type:complete
MTEKQLLIDVLSIQTSSGQETMMINYIQDFVKTNVPEASLVIKENNVYVTKGVSEHYPCIVSHTDTVHDIHKDFRVYDNDDILFAFSNDKMQQVGVGGDDKVGVWICLQMLLELDIVKCAFFHSEEIGCIGSSQADMSWFKDVGYVFQSDRRGNNDFVNSIGGKTLFDKSFSKKIANVLFAHDYKETSGAMTDVEQLVDNGLDVCCANMSSGYYNPHTDTEVVDYIDAENCLNLIYNLVKLLGCNVYKNKDFGKYEFDRYKSPKNYWKNYKYEYDYNCDGYNEVVFEDGKEICYYCGNTVGESAFGIKDYRHCSSCNSEVYFDSDLYDDYDDNPKLDKLNNTIIKNY